MKLCAKHTYIGRNTDITDDVIGEHMVVVGVANFNEHNTVNRKLSGFASCKMIARCIIVVCPLENA